MGKFLREQVLEVLRLVLQCDKGNFLDEATFNRIMRPLVSQLDAEPRGDWQEDALDPTLARDASQTDPGRGNDTYGDAVVETLVQMGVSAGSDHLLKPLHHEVRLHAFPSATDTEGLDASHAV